VVALVTNDFMPFPPRIEISPGAYSIGQADVVIWLQYLLALALIIGANTTKNILN
jgi:hypothetical protein